MAVVAVGAAGCGATGHATGQTTQKARRGSTRVVSVPWRLLAAKGRVVSLRWLGGGCLSPDGTRVVETAYQVTITVLASLYVPGQGEACAVYARIYIVHVRLGLA
jgi:hypothetical protein